ncbi:MAG: SDR family oxidoreductase [Rhodospirillales bacterium]
MSGLEGKRVVVTAGAAGIGRTVAKAFVDAGARVHVCDVDSAAIEAFRADLPSAVANVADVTDEAAVAKFFGTVGDGLGGLDILVNNAGIAGPAAPVEAMDYAGWQACLDINLGGTFLATRSAIPLLRAAGGGSIVNMSSTAGLFGFPNRSPYCVAKWGVIGFTKTLAMELGKDGIRANAICPGAVEGDRMERVLAAESAASGRSIDDIRRAYVDCTSMKTWVTAQDIADAILFLCSDQAARISGLVLPVDGHSESIM